MHHLRLNGERASGHERQKVHWDSLRSHLKCRSDDETDAAVLGLAGQAAESAPAWRSSLPAIARGGGSGLGRDGGMSRLWWSDTATASKLQRGCMVTPSRRSIEVRLGRGLPIRESDRSNGCRVM